MRYPADHKAKTRQRIVRAAGRLFRRHGYRGVGIEAIMETAGLTHGGFYAHFRSKAALFAAVMADEHDLIERLRAREGSSPSELTEQAVEVLSAYLDPANRERVGLGCPMAASSADVARGSRAVRSAFGDKLAELVSELGRGLAKRRGSRHPDPRALQAAALSVGTLTLARACGDEALAAELSAAGRDGVEKILRRPR